MINGDNISNLAEGTYSIYAFNPDDRPAGWIMLDKVYAKNAKEAQIKAELIYRNIQKERLGVILIKAKPTKKQAVKQMLLEE